MIDSTIVAQDPVINVYPPAGTPGWLVPVIAGGFLLLGGLLTFWYTSVNDKRRHRAEENRRWDDNLRTATSQYVEAVAGFVAAGAAYHNAKEANEAIVEAPSINVQEEKRQDAKRAAKIREPLDVAQAVMEGRLVALLLVGPKDVRDAARIVRDLALRDSGLWSEARKPIRAELRESILKLISEVRKGLRVSSGDDASLDQLTR